MGRLVVSATGRLLGIRPHTCLLYPEVRNMFSGERRSPSFYLWDISHNMPARRAKVGTGGSCSLIRLLRFSACHPDPEWSAAKNPRIPPGAPPHPVLRDSTHI